MAWTVRPMKEADLDGVMAIQARSYIAPLQEGRATFEGRLRLFPQGCFVLEQTGHSLGYAFCHPDQRDAVTPLDTTPRVPTDPDGLYIHDLCVDPEARGTGGATALAEAILALASAMGLDHLALVAVQGAEPFWERIGFRRLRTLEYAPDVKASHMTLDKGCP